MRFVTIKIKVWDFPFVIILFHHFRHHIVLKNGASQRVDCKLLFVFNPQQKTKQSCIIKIPFGSFDNPFADVSVIWWKEKRNG